MDCPRCQTENPATARFCQNCGVALARAEPIQRCPNCQMTLPAGARFCMNCGHPLRASTPIDEARLSYLAAAVPGRLAEQVHAATHLAGERRTVTALFVDVVGSTALAERVDAKDWAAIMNGALDRCCSAIYRYEGTIARLLGDELLAFFGAPVAHEDDPLRAVHAALELIDAMREYAEEIGPKHGVEFAVRVSLSTGPVVVGPVDSDLQYEYSALGGAVNLAAHVESIKHSMTVLITEDTYRFVAPFFDCTDLGSIEIAGQTEPVRVYQVRGPKGVPERERGLAGLSSPMVGRDAELASLLELSQAVRAGVGRAVLIVGEPGLGKTRLIAEWQAADAGSSAEPPLQWAKGHCYSYSRELAYHLSLDLLRSLVGVPAVAAEPEARAALLALVRDLFGHDLFAPSGPPESHRDGGEPPGGQLDRDRALDVYAFLGHLLSLKLEGPALERVRHLDPQALQARYLAALRQLVRALAARRPLVLILENLHWADPSSTELLIQLLPLASSGPVLFCLVTRPDRDAPAWRLVSAAREAIGGRLTELTLNPLSEPASQQLVSNLLGFEALPERTRSLVFGKAEGNPLFVEEVIRMLIDRGAILSKDGKWIVGSDAEAVEIPDNLRGLLMARIDRLSQGVKNALRVASVIGRQFSVRVLEQVLSESDRGMRLISHLSTLESVGLVHVAQVVPELAYRFRHALVQDAAYASMLTDERQRLHLAVGEALERTYPEQLASRELAPTLAQHFFRAGGGLSPASFRALSYFTLAGDAALASYANREAERHYRSASGLARGLARPESERADLLAALGEALYQQSRFQDAIQTWREGIDLYQALEESDGVARLYARVARAIWSGGDTPESLKVCQKGLAEVSGAPEGPGTALLVHEAARAYLFNGLPDKARPLCQRALEMAERLGIADVQAEALATMGLLSDQAPEAALEALERAVGLAESAGLLSQAARAHVNLASIMLTTVGDFGAAFDHYQRAADLHKQRGNTAGALLSLVGVTDSALRLGDLGQVEATFAVMRPLLSELVDPGPAAFMFRINEATLLRYRGELAEAIAQMRTLQADARQRDDLHNLIEIDSQLADALLESPVLAGGPRIGELPELCADETEAVLSEAVQICERWGLSGVHPRCLLSEVHACQGRLKDARYLLAEAREKASSRPVAWEKVWLSIAEARVAAAEGHWAEALAAFETAVGICARQGMRWWWARMLHEWAEAHLSRGEPADLERASALLREALAIYQELGVPRYVALVEGKLQALKAKTYAQAVAHQKVTQELAAAGRIQEGFLPDELPSIPGWQLAATLEPARETSGDFYDFIPLPNGRWGIVVADVADKGMGAALYMALSRTLIRTYAGEYHTRPDYTLQVTNRRILADTQVSMFVTLFYGVLDPTTGTLTYCNAGHNPPFLLSAQVRADATGAVQELHRTGMPLGILADTAWEQKTVQPAPGDLLVLYTDGITDAHNVHESRFGEERLLGVAQANLGRSAGDVVEALLAEVHRFVGDAPQFDDIALVVLIRSPPERD